MKSLNKKDGCLFLQKKEHEMKSNKFFFHGYINTVILDIDTKITITSLLTAIFSKYDNLLNYKNTI